MVAVGACLLASDVELYHRLWIFTKYFPNLSEAERDHAR